MELWQESWETGYGPMDEEHRELAARLGALFEACEEADGPEMLMPPLAALMNYCRSHFEQEEQWMAAFGYPGEPGHARSHQELLEQLEFLGLRMAMGEGDTVCPEERDFLVNWLSIHIRNEDMFLAEFLKERVG